MGHIEPRHVPGVDNPADLFTKSVAAPTQRALGPMLSGQVMLNPVSKPLNALEKQEKKTGQKMTKKTKRTKTETIERRLRAPARTAMTEEICLMIRIYKRLRHDCVSCDDP